MALLLQQAVVVAHEELQLAGRALLPGFIDAHGHLPDYVATWGRPDLSPPPVGSTRRIADIQTTVRAY
ncbi:MAG: amidohydrolase, partial [Cyanobacteriota bacterium]